MNEKLQEQLALLVEKAIEAATKTGEFVIDQAPDLLQEFYAWNIAEDIGLIILGIFLISMIKIIPSIIGHKNKEDVKESRPLGTKKLMGRYSSGEYNH